MGERMATRVWRCDTCRGCGPSKPWECPKCKKETCESCFDRYCHCKTCSEGKTDEELWLAANADGYDFDSPASTNED